MCFIICVLFSIAHLLEVGGSEYTRDELSTLYPDYGQRWIFFPDGNGNPTVMVLDPGEEQQQRRFFDTPDVQMEEMNFWLYTRKNPNKYFALQYDNKTNLEESDFDAKRDTKIVVHGWRSSGNSDTCQEIKNALLERDDLNVIVLDWERNAGDVIYFGPMHRTRSIGYNGARMIDYLIEHGATADQFHIIGHSLGAHISGITASNVSKGRVGRVTGLDPALPGFEGNLDTKYRLDDTDAEFVDAIHTCAGFLGFCSPLAHVDVYPNGGHPSQPGCGGLPEFTEACSHGRAWQFFAESVNAKNAFKAYPCSSWQEFKDGECLDQSTVVGYCTDTKLRGSYYTLTNNKSPYFMTEEVIVKLLDRGETNEI